MTYYIFLDNGKLNGCGQCPCLNEEIENIEVTQEVYNLYSKTPDKYIYQNGEIIENPNYEAEQALKERKRLDMLTLTAADVERAIYKAKGMDFDDIIELVKDNPMIDLKALKIELKANNFYRKNPYINQVGSLLGYTSKDLDYLFVNKFLPDVNNSTIKEDENTDTEPDSVEIDVNNEEK